MREEINVYGPLYKATYGLLDNGVEYISLTTETVIITEFNLKGLEKTNEIRKIHISRFNA